MLITLALHQERIKMVRRNSVLLCLIKPILGNCYCPGVSLQKDRCGPGTNTKRSHFIFSFTSIALSFLAFVEFQFVYELDQHVSNSV